MLRQQEQRHVRSVYIVRSHAQTCSFFLFYFSVSGLHVQRTPFCKHIIYITHLLVTLSVGQILLQGDKALLDDSHFIHYRETNQKFNLWLFNQNHNFSLFSFYALKFIKILSKFLSKKLEASLNTERQWCFLVLQFSPFYFCVSAKFWYGIFIFSARARKWTIGQKQQVFIFHVMWL